MGDMKIRPATIADADILLAWRNDETTRLQSHNQHAVERDSHIRWLESVLSNPDRHLFVAEIDGRLAATFRADNDGDTFELSWTVAPWCRGRGIGRALVKLAVAMFPNCRAEIKEGNTASERIAISCGMSLEMTANGIRHYRSTAPPPSASHLSREQ